ncbi:MAG TPA: O-antigen ligase family protein [Chloroflexota bacterium]|nr:O-antigen ligase family protein [Chloroflexota bacterium]
MIASPRIPVAGRLDPRAVLALVGAMVVCGGLDAGLMEWIQIGPPGHKGQLFFVELVILVAAALVVLATALLAPEKARVATPFLFMGLAWHTGFQVQLGSDKFVLTVFDVLVPITLLMAIVGGWFGTASGATWFHRHWRLMVIFWLFCLWGVCVALYRGVDPSPLISNLKSLVIYPLILILLPLCIRSWKQLYLATGFMLALITERALDGLRQAATHATTAFATRLNGGQLITRIDGDMAATNQYATYLLTGFLIMMALVGASKLRARHRMLMTIPLGCVGLALLLTYSRGAWLGTGMATVALIFILRPKRGAAVLATTLLFVLLLQVVYPQADKRFVARATQYDYSIAQRESYQATGFDVVLRYPLGAGWGAWFQRTASGIQPVPGYPWYHDDYLQLATEIGIPGLLSIVAVLVSLLLLGLRASRAALSPTKTALLAGLTAAFFGMLVQTGTDQFLWHADIAPHIWIVGGLIASGAMLVGVDAAELRGRRRFAPVPPEPAPAI